MIGSNMYGCKIYREHARVAWLVLKRLQDASEAFNSFQSHDDIGALELPQIPENDKGAIRQILLPSESLKPFFSVCQPRASPL